ncbi:MAG: sigma-54-dependent transcriptional regulator [Pseudomonadota bacterium]|jgi:two-component system repressor protein LuxO
MAELPTVPIRAGVRPHVLVVDDSDSLRAMLLAYLRDQPLSLAAVGTAAEALRAIDYQRPDVILLDMQLPDAQGLTLFDSMRRHAPHSAIVVITAFGSVGLAVDATQAGAVDFIEKPVTRERLMQSMRNALQRVLLEQRIQRVAGEIAGAGLHGLLGASQAMRDAIRSLRAAAASSAPLLLLGEPGSGARLAVRAVHREGPRAARSLVAVACRAAGAAGRLDAALSGDTLGTLALHDVDALPEPAQDRLLAALEQPRGDWRLVACSTLEASALSGPLRAELVHRLHVVPVILPPLRWREDDVLVLARHFMAIDAAAEGKRFDGFDPDAVTALQRHQWPGNVAELRNAMRQVAALFDGGTVGAADLPAGLRDARDGGGAGIEPLWMVEQRAIRAAIAACGGDHATAAARLQVSVEEMERRLLQPDPKR